jgi:hypothetical protein
MRRNHFELVSGFDKFPRGSRQNRTKRRWQSP